MRTLQKLEIPHEWKPDGDDGHYGRYNKLDQLKADKVAYYSYVRGERIMGPPPSSEVYISSVTFRSGGSIRGSNCNSTLPEGEAYFGKSKICPSGTYLKGLKVHESGSKLSLICSSKVKDQCSSNLERLAFSFPDRQTWGGVDGSVKCDEGTFVYKLEQDWTNKKIKLHCKKY